MAAPEIDPRVPLAAERTLLAWTRTGLAIMGFGFVVARFSLFLRELAGASAGAVRSTGSSYVGVALVAAGVAVNVGAAVRYRRIGAALARGESPEISLGAASILAFASAAGGVVLVVLLAFALLR